MPKARTDVRTLLTIGELSARTGVATSALRFYEERGLIRSTRNAAGHRRYLRAVARRVALIVFSQQLGFSLGEIRGVLDHLPADQIPTGADWERLTQIWHERIAQRIAELERIRDGLTDCIGCGCLSLERCKLLNPDDCAAHYGAGPRYWLGDEPPPGPEGSTALTSPIPS